jgi:hypothetical protein
MERLRNQIRNLLRNFQLKNSSSEVLAFEKVVNDLTKEQIDAVGQGFPFTGDATIDGILNIDFTETLSFFTGKDDGDDLMGFRANNEHGSVFMGVTGDEDEVVALRILESDLGTIQDFTLAEDGFVAKGENATFPDDDVTFEKLTFGIEGVGAFSTWKKENNDGTEVQFGYGSNEDGLVLANTLSDPAASLFDFRDDNGDSILEVRNDGLFVGPNIPTIDPLVLGQIWLDGDTLKVSAGTP